MTLQFSLVCGASGSAWPPWQVSDSSSASPSQFLNRDQVLGIIFRDLTVSTNRGNLFEAEEQLLCLETFINGSEGTEGSASGDLGIRLLSITRDVIHPNVEVRKQTCLVNRFVNRGECHLAQSRGNGAPCQYATVRVGGGRGCLVNQDSRTSVDLDSPT